MNILKQNISNKEKDILMLLAEYRILTTRQISFINSVGLRAIQKTIKSLSDKGFISQSYSYFSPTKGRPQSLLSLNEKSIDFLKSDPGSKIFVKSPKEISAEKLNIKHEIEVNWFRLQLINIESQITDLRTEFISPHSLFIKRRTSGSPAIADVTPVEGYKKWFVPDGAFVIQSKSQQKSLLFFLEVDMGTESLSSNNSDITTIASKLKCYYSYFKNRGFKRYQKKWPENNINGFRVLFVCNSQERKEAICRYLISFDMFNFIWITVNEQLQQNGLAANIWIRGGNNLTYPKSILGPSLALNSSQKLK